MASQAREIKRLIDRLQRASGAVSEAASLPQFGTADCEPFWRAGEELDRCVAKLETLVEYEKARPN